MIKSIAQGILDIYDNVVVPQWKMKCSPVGPINKELAAHVEDTKFKSGELKSMISSYLQWDKVATKSLI